jgi:hypothetical protein
MTYLKIVLTLIAVCLTVLTLDTLNILPKAYATPQATNATPQTYGLVPVNADGSITVKLAPNETLDVNVKSVDGRSLFNGMLPVAVNSSSNPLEVNLKLIDGRSVYTSYIPVDIRAVDGSGIFNGAVPVQQR